MLKKLLVLIMAVLLIAGVSGCGKSQDLESENTALQEDRFEDRELIVGVPEINVNFNPYYTVNGNDLLGKNQIYDYLVTKGKDGKIEGSLAESYDVATDGLEYIFYLRKGVKFSNGSELKASDVKFSIDKNMNSPYTADGFVDVEKCEVVDDYTISIQMKTPSVSFLEKLTDWFGAIVNEEVVKEYGDDFGNTTESAIGTGPYILKEWQPGEVCTFESNPNYFKGEADIKKIKFKAIKDSNAAVIALQTGEIDLYASDLPEISIDMLMKNEKLNVLEYSSNMYMFVLLNTESGVFSDVRMRQAVAYAVDREKMLMVGTEGYGTIVDYPGGPDFTGNPNLKTWYSQDTEKAKKLVKEAGMEGKGIIIKTRAMSSFPKLATSLQDDLNKIGLSVEVLQMENNAFLDDVYKNGQFDIGISRYGAITKDMDEILYGQLHSDNIGIYNCCRYSNSEMDQLLIEAKAEMNEDKRKDIYGEVVKLFTEDAVEIPLYYTEGSRSYTKDLIIGENFTEMNDDYFKYDRMYHYSWND